jgi:hypothetical protein
MADCYAIGFNILAPGQKPTLKVVGLASSGQNPIGRTEEGSWLAPRSNLLHLREQAGHLLILSLVFTFFTDVARPVCSIIDYSATYILARLTLVKHLAIQET